MKRMTSHLATALVAFGIGAFALPTLAEVAAPGPAGKERPRFNAPASVEGEFAPRADRRGPRGDRHAPRAEGRRGQRPGGPDGGFAPPPRPHGPGHEDAKALFPFWNNENLAADLGLTDEQIDALEESWELTRAQLEASEGSIADAMSAQREELQKDNPDLDTVYALADATTAATSAKKKIVLGHVVTVKTVLTAEQEAQLKGNVRSHIGKRLARGEFREMRDEVRSALKEAGTLEDAEAILDEHGLDGRMREMIMRRIERRFNGAPAPDAAPMADWEAPE